MNLGTYIIENYIVNHPVVGQITKQRIIYYNRNNEIETIEFYDGYIREGYTPK